MNDPLDQALVLNDICKTYNVGRPERGARAA